MNTATTINSYDLDMPAYLRREDLFAENTRHQAAQLASDGVSTSQDVANLWNNSIANRFWVLVDIVSDLHIVFHDDNNAPHIMRVDAIGRLWVDNAYAGVATWQDLFFIARHMGYSVDMNEVLE